MTTASRFLRSVPCSLAILVALWSIPVSAADKPSDKGKSSAAEKTQKKDAAAIGESKVAVETAAIEFAREHHPELASLLKQLKTGSPQGYQEAVRDLSRVNDRLTRLRSRSPERHELELELWKLDSRIRLLAARLTMSDEPELRDQLQTLIRKKQDVRKSLLEDEQQRIASRLDRIRSDLAELEKDREALVEAEQERLLKSARASASRNRRFRSPAGKEPASKVSKPRPQSSESTPKTTPRQPD